MAVRIRSMTAEDSRSVAGLCDQLGYPATPDDIARRLARIDGQGHAAVFVAEEGHLVIGWIHAAIAPVLESDLYAEICGLVVDATHRSHGVGATLLHAAEQWARNAGCVSMRVRSRVARERAHNFYERHGYDRVKTQHAFQKNLS
jgi:GNAT superfamily N-acetyltransferase